MWYKCDSVAHTQMLWVSVKNKKTKFLYEKSLTNCPLFDMKRLFAFGRLLTSDSFFGRTIPRRLSEERFWFPRFRQWLIKTETWKLRLDNFSVSSDFSGLRAEVTLEKETPEFRKVTSWAENETFRLCLETTFMNSDSILSQFCLNSVLREFLQLSAEKHILRGLKT